MNTDKIYAEQLANEYALKDTSKVVALRKLDKNGRRILPTSQSRKSVRRQALIAPPFICIMKQWQTYFRRASVT